MLKLMRTLARRPTVSPPFARRPSTDAGTGGSLLTTIDGLTINEEMQVLNTEGVVIEGLYAAGDCSGSLFAGTYPEYVVGLACGRSSTQGRHIARRLAGDL